MPTSGRRTAVGIDPGRKGWAVELDDAGQVVAAQPLPFFETTSLIDEAALMCMVDGAHVAALERPSSPRRFNPATGRSEIVAGKSATTIFTNYGIILATLKLAGLRVEIVSPQTWQRRLCPGTGDPKGRSIEAATRLLPDLDLTPGRKRKPDDNIADAGLLALYARRYCT